MKFKLIFGFVIFLIAISVVYAENNDTVMAAGSFNDLQNIINEAPENSKILLNEDYSQSSSQIIIDKSLTIDGQGHVIDGQGKTNLFRTSQGTLTLKNMIIQNGYYEGEIGAALDIAGAAEVFIINCTFNNNIAYRGELLLIWVHYWILKIQHSLPTQHLRILVEPYFQHLI